MPKVRYLVTLAQLPDEATWCTSRSINDLRQKLKDLWLLDEPVCKFYVGTGSTSSIAMANMVTEEEFQLWLREDPATGEARPMSSRVVAYDKVNEVRVKHSSDPQPVPRRPLVSLDTIDLMTGAFSLRHSALNEVIVVPAAREEAICWGVAVRRVQEAWGVVRPLFRYLDQSTGERLTVNVLNAEDFCHWLLHGRPISPELVVFEHAPESVVREKEKEKNAQRQRVSDEATLKKFEDAVVADTAKAANNNVDNRVPTLMNPYSAQRLETHALLASNVKQKTEAEKHLEKLKRLV